MLARQSLTTSTCLLQLKSCLDSLCLLPCNFVASTGSFNRADRLEETKDDKEDWSFLASFTLQVVFLKTSVLGFLEMSTATLPAIQAKWQLCFSKAVWFTFFKICVFLLRENTVKHWFK